METLINPMKKSFVSTYGSSFKVGEVTLTDGIFKKSQDTGKEYIL